MAGRDALLVNYLADNPVWQDLIAIFESVWGDSADELATQLAQIRDLHRVAATNPDLLASDMLGFDDYQMFDRQTMVRICNLLGFSYPNINNRLFSTEDYLRIAQNVADYYKEQGTDAFIRFFSYCLNSWFNLKPMWTQDYKTFVPEGDYSIGTPVWEGGTWYPTTHVQFEVDVLKSPGLSPDGYRDFFYYIAPINLVLLATLFKIRMSVQLNIACVGRLRVRTSSVSSPDGRLNVAMSGRLLVTAPSQPTSP
jgi:hypothetical protein